jgi:hypothetical protein
LRKQLPERGGYPRERLGLLARRGTQAAGGSKDYAPDEISAGPWANLKRHIEKGILDEFEELISCSPCERTEACRDYWDGFCVCGHLTTIAHIPEVRFPRAGRRR